MAVRDTESQHSSDFIQRVVEDIMKGFEISKQQVLAVVTDNASNMTLAVQKSIDRSSKVTVMDAISRYPSILQKVAYKVTALPSTQVSVERLFSALRIIRSDLRTSMKEDLLEAILFFRTNGCGKLCV